jgi:hypothetical protein
MQLMLRDDALKKALLTSDCFAFSISCSFIVAMSIILAQFRPSCAWLSLAARPGCQPRCGCQFCGRHWHYKWQQETNQQGLSRPEGAEGLTSAFLGDQSSTMGQKTDQQGRLKGRAPAQGSSEVCREEGAHQPVARRTRILAGLGYQKERQILH